MVHNVESFVSFEMILFHRHGKQAAQLKPFCSADECPYTEILFPDGHSISSFTP